MRIVEDVPGERLVLRGGPFGWRRITFDRRAVTARPGLFSTLRRSELAVSELCEPTLSLRRVATGAPFAVELRARPFALAFAVEHLDREEEALDLLHRLAAVLGFERYHLLQKDDAGLEVELRRAAGKVPFRGALGEEVLVPLAHADYRPVGSLKEEVGAAPRRRAGFMAPATPGSRFSETTTFDGARVVAWRPRERVAITRPARHPVRALLFLLFVAPFRVLFGSALFVALAMTASMVLFAPVAMVADKIGATASRIAGVAFLAIFVGAWVVGALAISWDALRRFRGMLARETVFDWAGTVTFRLWRMKRVFRLDQIQGFTILENSGSEKQKNKKEKYWEWCELEVRVPGLDEVIVKTDRKETPGSAHAELSPLAVELARALDVPLRVRKGWAPFY